MAYIPELKVELVDLINKGNNLSIGESDIELSSPNSTDPVVEVRVTPSNGSDYYGNKWVAYTRRDPAKFFKNIPVMAFVDNLGKTVTGFQVVGVINSYWGDLIDYDDIETEDLTREFTLGELISTPATFRIKSSSAAWIGTLSLSVAQSFINLSYIVSNGTVSLANPSTYSMRTYSADFTPFANLLNAVPSSGTIEDDVAYLVGRGFAGVDIKGASIVYNGLTAALAGYKVNVGYSNVLLLKPVGGVEQDIVYVHYNYDPVQITAIGTEDGKALTTESGRILVLG